MNAFVYTAAAVGYVRLRRSKISVSDPAQLFVVLESVLRKAFPDLSAGFTWREAFRRLQTIGMKADWDQISTGLEQYEGWRYGGETRPANANPELVKLVNALSQRGGSWQRV